MRTMGRNSLVASPVLVGSVTVLVAIIAVVLAYNANRGLPFVPTYTVKAEIPGGSNLVRGNDVRMGGFRVGVVERILPGVASPGESSSNGSTQRAIALIEMKLDKDIEPLAKDTTIEIRPRSALGLKYVALTPGDSKETFRPGGTIPLAQSTKPIELDEFFGIQNDEFRTNIRKVYEGYGTALSGRGEAINETIRDARPLFVRLEPVFRNLSAPSTELDNFFRQAGRTSAQIAPVADTYASLFRNIGITFEALSRNDERLQATIERLRPTLDEGISSFRVQRPFLRDTARLSARLEPVAREIERSLPLVADAFEVGAPVQAKAPILYRNTRRVFASLEDLAANPNTLLALSDLRRTLEVATPLVEYVAPYQTVCNYATYWLTGLSEHVSEIVPGGTGQRSLDEVREQHPGQPRQLHRGRPPGGRAGGRQPQDRNRCPGPRPPGPARRRVRLGDRRPGQCRLRGRPARLRDRPERARRPLPALDGPREGGRQPRRARPPGQPPLRRDLQVA